jgi:1-acyl-sn-glycerol-3-phosphate acyltransferase
MASAATGAGARAILPRVQRTPRPSWLYAVLAVLSWPVLKFVFRLRATGLGNVPAKGGFVLAANHWSNLDPWPLGLPLFPRRFLRFMAKSELFWFPLGSIVRAGGAFPVRRGQGDEEAIARAVALCREGHVVVMFPEGTRRRKGLRKKHEARWHTGAARIALDASVPLVPAGIAGTERLARLGPLRVAYGPSIELGDLSVLPLDEAAEAATERLRESIHELERSIG